MSVLGDSDTGAGGNSSVRLWVRRRLLEHVPYEPDAATLCMIAVRAGLDIHTCRGHLACMSEDVFVVENPHHFDQAGTLHLGRTHYYRKRTEDDMTHDHDPQPLADRILGLRLGLGRDGMTILAIAHALHVRPANVSTTLLGMIELKQIERTGAGKKGDPYRYHRAREDGTAAPTDADAIALVPDVETAETGATTSPLPVDPAEVAHCYAVVIDDVAARALAASAEATVFLDDAKVLAAAATLLERILDGEADR